MIDFSLSRPNGTGEPRFEGRSNQGVGGEVAAFEARCPREISFKSPNQ